MSLGCYVYYIYICLRGSSERRLLKEAYKLAGEPARERCSFKLLDWTVLLVPCNRRMEAALQE